MENHEKVYRNLTEKVIKYANANWHGSITCPSVLYGNIPVNGFKYRVYGLTTINSDGHLYVFLQAYPPSRKIDSASLDKYRGYIKETPMNRIRKVDSVKNTSDCNESTQTSEREGLLGDEDCTVTLQTNGGDDITEGPKNIRSRSKKGGMLQDDNGESYMNMKGILKINGIEYTLYGYSYITKAHGIYIAFRMYAPKKGDEPKE